MVDTTAFKELLNRYYNNTCSVGEKKELLQLLQDPQYDAALQEWVATVEISSGEELALKQDAASSILTAIFHATDTRKSIRSGTRRVHFLKKTWFRYAAAIILVCSAGAYLWMSNKKESQPSLANGNKQLPTTIGPGGERAVLTLADGSKIILDKAANGNLAQQGNTQVVKLADGQLAYDVKDNPGKETMWNTMSTPAGGQYQVRLPDGTKVWLNAASSITYPTSFTGNKREVRIAGEVYFEVTPLRLRSGSRVPFIVDVDGKSLVEVLGTSFNINSYADENSIKTTLIEGSVRIVNRQSAIGNGNPSDQSVTLKPGEQALLSISSQSLKSRPGLAEGIQVQTPDLDQVMAWKNGLFNFNRADLYEVMRQLGRWYDIKVQYQGTVHNINFRGKMHRSANLSDVLEMLQEMGVKIKLEGRTLTVTE